MIKIGRNPSSDIKIDERWDTVSNNHADITIEEGKVIFTDHSSNGTIINGRKIHNRSIEIHPGDKIFLANAFPLEWDVISGFINVDGVPTVTRNIHGKATGNDHRLTERFSDIKSDMRKWTIWNFPPKQESSDDNTKAHSEENLTNHRKGELFHGRYLLVAPLGSGASGEVWVAKDTLANNLVVAIKIFSQKGDIDTYGLQDFEHEFTTVYNMKHSNLLPPTGYNVCGGKPYLIMQFCENGSCNSMAGRTDEEDLIRFLHDVAAGLEYLHEHNIIHQDIKPDNILLDDNCNFLVTDFGISVKSSSNDNADEEMTGGTRAYMGPERFEGKTTAASDIWALGATAVELLTGTPPYGDHGGLLQAQGEPYPDLPKELQPEVKAIITGALNPDPEKRITAEEIRKKTQRYLETGSWKVVNKNRYLIYGAAIVAAVLLGIGIFIWDYNRTKVVYYKDYAEIWGVPKGIGKLSKGDVSHREFSYRFEYKQGKLRRASVINSKGKVVSFTDSEQMNRYPDARYFYTDQGKIDYIAVYDTNGRMLYKLDYDDNLKTATFRQNDEYGTEMNLYSNTNQLYKDFNNDTGEKSRISRYLLDFNEDGLLAQRRYVGLQNVPASDKDNIFGERYEYDEKGRKVKKTFIGADGNVTGNSNGLATSLYKYDDKDNWIEVSYLDTEGNGSHDGNNCTVVKLEYDKYGNRTAEKYYTMDYQPALRADANVAGYVYEVDDHGNQISQTGIDPEGKPIFNSQGFMTMRNYYDDNGFVDKIELLDESGKNIMANRDGNVFSVLHFKNTDTGLPLEVAFHDEQDKPIEQGSGVAKIVNTFDETGNLLTQSYFNQNGSPTLYNGFYHKRELGYDQFNNVVEEKYLDYNGNPSTFDGRVAVVKMDYNRQGALTTKEFLGLDGNLTPTGFLSAGYNIEYDELGNQKKISYFNQNRQPVMTEEGYSCVEYEYEPSTNFLIAVNYRDIAGKEINKLNYHYNSKGNQIKNFTTRNGKLAEGTAVENFEYDNNNRLLATTYTNLSGNKILKPGSNYSRAEYSYDELGNCKETTFWKTDGSAGLDENSTHRRVRDFDSMNRVIGEKNYGTDGKPVNSRFANPEGKIEYDRWGNIATIACYDGYGNPSLSTEGYHVQNMTYDLNGNILAVQYLDTDRNPIVNSVYGYHKAINKFDTHGNKIETYFYDLSGCFRQDKYKYNDRNSITEELICDGNGKATDKFYGVCRLVINYDNTGVTPKSRKLYNSAGSVLVTQTWDDKKGMWL